MGIEFAIVEGDVKGFELIQACEPIVAYFIERMSFYDRLENVFV